MEGGFGDVYCQYPTTAAILDGGSCRSLRTRCCVMRNTDEAAAKSERSITPGDTYPCTLIKCRLYLYIDTVCLSLSPVNN